MPMLHFFRQGCKRQKFLLLYQNVIPPQTLSQQFWSFSEQRKETLTVESVFGTVICGWIRELEFFKRDAIKDIFFLIIFITQFPNDLSLKNMVRDFFRCASLIKWIQYFCLRNEFYPKSWAHARLSCRSSESSNIFTGKHSWWRSFLLRLQV